MHKNISKKTALKVEIGMTPWFVLENALL